MVISTPLAIIDGNIPRPLLGIHRAVLALRLAIFHENIGVEELARHAAVEMINVELRLSLACSPAPRGCSEQSQALRFSVLSADAGFARTEANVLATTASGLYGTTLVPAPSPSGVSVIGAAGISATVSSGMD